MLGKGHASQPAPLTCQFLSSSWRAQRAFFKAHRTLPLLASLPRALPHSWPSWHLFLWVPYGSPLVSDPGKGDFVPRTPLMPNTCAGTGTGQQHAYTCQAMTHPDSLPFLPASFLCTS
ncbi:hypothetical protein PAL_GLEAN10024126 [Pteropus alecto]|uniref:Uncharacterized protein n=1 Tax=Pteropus alecto TaxID=9402 RepID=L5JX41_PTEAL|nr:hypothetical protein PAL_GLEAN10024126 [Pteropus alecto]